MIEYPFTPYKITPEILREEGACWTDERIAKYLPKAGLKLSQIARIDGRRLNHSDFLWVVEDVVMSRMLFSDHEIFGNEKERAEYDFFREWIEKFDNVYYELGEWPKRRDNRLAALRRALTYALEQRGW